MDELAKRFADLAEKYGPAVADAAKSAARMEAISQLVSGFMTVCIGIALMLLARWIWRKAGDADRGPYSDSELAYAGAVLIGLIGLIPFCIGVWSWIDPWTWTTISHPDLWIAKRAFHL